MGSLRFILGPFAAEARAAGHPWERPRGDRQWRHVVLAVGGWSADGASATAAQAGTALRDALREAGEGGQQGAALCLLQFAPDCAPAFAWEDAKRVLRLRSTSHRLWWASLRAAPPALSWRFYPLRSEAALDPAEGPRVPWLGDDAVDRRYGGHRGDRQENLSAFLCRELAQRTVQEARADASRFLV